MWFDSKINVVFDDTLSEIICLFLLQNQGCLWLCIEQKVSEYDQEMQQSQTADQLIAPLVCWYC